MLIKIYNDISRYNEQFEAANEQSRHLIKKNCLQEAKTIEAFLDQQLINFNSLKSAFAENIFFHYLNFLLNYTCSLIVEFAYKLSYEKMKDTFPTLLNEKQAKYIRLAHADLIHIEQLESQKDNINHSLGKEYFLGRPIFDRFPLKNHNDIISHLLELLEAKN